MSTPPPHPGQETTSDRSQPGDAPAGAPAAGGLPAPRSAKYGTHQVLWGIGGVILGLAVGVLGTEAESSPAPASAARASPGSALAARPATVPRPASRGTTIDGEGMFVIGQDIRRGVWHTAGAVGGPTGECYVALMRKAGTWSVIDSYDVTRPDTITTTRRTKAIRTSGCKTWHRVAGYDLARSQPDARSDRIRSVSPGGRRHNLYRYKLRPAA